MDKAAFDRLAPFLVRKGPRQKLILYLIADGHKVADLVAMSTYTLKKLRLPVEMTVYRDQMFDDGEFQMAFTYPGGAHIPHTTYYRLIRSTALKVLGRPMSQDQFRDDINKEK